MLSQTLVFLGFIVILLASIVIIIFMNISISKYNTNQTYCQTDSCLKYANLLHDYIDEAVDPCESFYEFTCGKFLKEKKIKDDQHSYSTFSIIQDNLDSKISSILNKPHDKNDNNIETQLKNFYLSCTNLDEIENNSEAYLKNFIENEFGGWFIFSNKKNNLSPIEIMSRMGIYKSFSLFDIEIYPNPKNGSQKNIAISQPDMIDKSYFEDENFSKVYKNFIKNIINYFNSTNFDDDDVNKLFLLIKELSQAQTDLIDNSINFKIMSVLELEMIFPNFQWEDFIIKGLFKNLTILNKNETLIVYNWDYVQKAIEIYHNYSLNDINVLKNFLFLNFIQDYLDSLPLKYIEARSKYEVFLNGITTMPDRKQFCTNLVFENMPLSIGNLYIIENFNENSKKNAVEMAKNILKEFELVLNDTTWMDEISKSEAIKKARAIDAQIGYPYNIFNSTYLEKLYGKDFQSDFLAKNLLELSKFKFNKEVKEFRLLVDKNEWYFSPAELNAFYEPSSNQIYLPSGILQFPLYDFSLPNYLNYGSMGAIIGHEISHGFDNHGRFFDKDGVFFPEGLWTNKTSEQFKQKSECVIDEYSNFLVKKINKTINGKQTLGENIADNGGIKASNRAYQKWFSKHGKEKLLPNIKFNQNQLFFISYGVLWCEKIRDERLNNMINDDVHSPHEYRVIGTTSNSEYFNKAFNCKLGQKNHPIKKCEVW